MAVIITLAMLLLVASAALAMTGTGRRGKGPPGRDDRNRTDAARVPIPEEPLLGTATLVVGGAEEPASPHQRLQVADVRLTAWPPTGDPRPGHPAGPSRIVPLAGRRLAGR